MCGYFCIGFIDFMLAGKTLTELQIFFHEVTLKKRWYNSKIFYDKFLKMAEYNSIDHGFHETTNTYPNLNAAPLSDQQHFTLNKMKLMIVAEINERELMNKRLSKYIASFDYFD